MSRWKKFLVMLCIASLCTCTAWGADTAGMEKKDITVEVDSAVTQFVTVTVVRADEDLGVSDFADITADNLPQVFHSMQTVTVTPSDTSAAFQIQFAEDDPYGKYLIRVTYVGVDSKDTYSEYDSYIKFSEEQITDLLEDAYQSEEPLGVLEDMAELDLLDGELCKAAAEISDFNARFIALRGELYPQGYADRSAVERTASYAVVMSSFQTMDENDLATYLADADLSGIFEEDTVDLPKLKEESYARNYIDIRDDKTATAEAFAAEVNAAVGMMLLREGTVAEKAEALGDYADVLGLDLSLAEDKDISLISIAKRLDADTLEKLSASYDEAIEELDTSHEEEEDDDRRQSGGGGGGGGGGGFSISPAPASVTLPAPVTQTVPSEEVQTVRFADVPESHWATKEIYSLAGKKIIAGENGVFRPEEYVTRAEFLKMIVLALDIPMEGEDVSFGDCPKSAWYYPYVCAGSNAGIIYGESTSFFGAQKSITREDAAVIVERALAQRGANGEIAFTDADDISPYALSSVKAVCGFGLMTGFPDGTIKPQQNITRAESAALIERVMEYKNNAAGGMSE